MELLNIENIVESLTTKYIGRKITYLETTTSTNDVARELCEKGEIEGALVISETQISGRGRMFRKWETRSVDSIAMTLLLRPDLLPRDAPTITPVLALSIVEGLRSAVEVDTLIKWPNDIFIGNKKLGGILTEMNSGMDVVKYIIIGVGLNINQSDMGDTLNDIAISLKEHTGKTYEREIIISHILNRFEINYENYNKHGLVYFREKLKEYSSILGKEVIVISALEMIEGVAEDLDENGNLILRLENGNIKKIIYGDVSIKCKDLLKD